MIDRDTVIRLARQAEGEEQQHGMWRMHVEDLERFAGGIAAYLTDISTHSCHSECNRFACVAVRQAVDVEREKCAKIIENYCGAWNDEGYALAAAIRNRK